MNQQFRMLFCPAINTHFKALAIVVIAFGFAQCSKDVDPNEDLNNKLNTSWDVESFRIDGEEQIQYTISSFEMDFDKETANTGETNWTIIDDLGIPSISEFDYEIMNDGKRIEIQGDEFNIEIDGDFLTIDGNVDGYFWEIDAEKQ